MIHNWLRERERKYKTLPTWSTMTCPLPPLRPANPRTTHVQHTRPHYATRGILDHRPMVHLYPDLATNTFSINPISSSPENYFRAKKKKTLFSKTSILLLYIWLRLGYMGTASSPLSNRTLHLRRCSLSEYLGLDWTTLVSLQSLLRRSKFGERNRFFCRQS
jgi:hypothetical protein